MKNVPLRDRLFRLAAAAILPVAVVSGIALLVFFRQQQGQALRGGLDITRALGTAVDAEIRRTVSVLEVLSTSPLLDIDDLASFRGRAERLLAVQPNWRVIILATPDGTVLLNTRHTQGPLPPVADIDSFRRAVAEARPVVGDLARGFRGEWAIPVRIPVERAGRLRYILTAAVGPDAFLEIVQRQQVPRDWVVSIFDSKQQRIARSREAQHLGAPPAPSLKALMDISPEGVGETRTLEGEPVYSAHTRLAEPRWTIAIGIPEHFVNVAAWRSLAVYGGGVILSIALGFFVALRLARSVSEPMAELRDAANAVGRGEAVAVPESDIQEIRAVAAALVETSERRRRHEGEREELLKREQSARAFAEAANKSKDEFLAMLGHELRNPLGAIVNAASLVNEPRVSAETRAQASAIILRQVGHLTRLTDDLLDAARALTGKIVLERHPTDLAALAALALRTLKAAGRTQKHRVVESLAPVWIDADPIRVDQIVANLVGNAVKYTPADGTITVSVAREGDDAVLRVADTGIGLPPDLAPRVFDLFVQGDRELDRSLGGLGIGLTLVRRLAEMHGGAVSVSSPGPGEGSEFTVRFPAIAPPAARTDPEAPMASAARPRDVLIVEDNDDARETLQTLLRLSGHRVHSAADGATGLQRALELRPEIMLVDIGLPRMDGYEVARRVREADGVQPFLVAITGYGTPEDRQRAIDAGFDAHLVKPIDLQNLDDVLRQAK
jgi:signal transduction histidine kinase